MINNDKQRSYTCTNNTNDRRLTTTNRDHTCTNNKRDAQGPQTLNKSPSTGSDEGTFQTETITIYTVQINSKQLCAH